MAQLKPSKHPNEKIKSGADKRLADILKKALNTPALHGPSVQQGGSGGIPQLCEALLE
jgi:hypothetical protein